MNDRKRTMIEAAMKSMSKEDALEMGCEIKKIKRDTIIYKGYSMYPTKEELDELKKQIEREVII